MKEIVIKMDNEHYERIMRLEEGVTVYPTTLALYDAVKSGTPLENFCSDCEVGNPCLYCKHEFKERGGQNEDSN